MRNLRDILQIISFSFFWTPVRCVAPTGQADSHGFTRTGNVSRKDAKAQMLKTGARENILTQRREGANVKNRRQENILTQRR